jgi:AcrR family transcriptional regulator
MPVTRRHRHRTVQPGAIELGRRESKKRENLQRIKAAAQECFIARGFDDVTMREIATRAGVGLGTLFRYAENKRDLLLLAVIEDVEAAVRRGPLAISVHAPLIKNLMAVLGPLLAFFGNPDQPVISRLLLTEILFYERGALARRFWQSRASMFDTLRQCIEYAVQSREIEQPDDIARVVWVIHAIYYAELRHFVSERLITAAALTNLKQSLLLFMRGGVQSCRPRSKRKRS